MKESWVRSYFSLLFLLLVTFLSGQSIGQASSARGLIAGAQFGSIHWKSDDLGVNDFVSAWAVKGNLSYGINEFLSIGINYLQSFSIREYEDEDFRLGTFQLESRLHLLGTESAFRPTLAASLNYTSANPKLIQDSTEAISDLKGWGMGVEGGIKYYFNPNLSVGINLNYFFGNYTNNVFGGQVLDEIYNYSILSYGVGLYYQIFHQ